MEKNCPYCKSKEISGDYCRRCRRRIKKRSVLWILLIFLLLVACYPLIDSIGFYASVKRDVFENVPYSIIRDVNVTIPLERYVCQNRSFRFTYFSGNVDSIGISVRPNFAVTNLEKEWGLFSINFSYIDEAKFPYDIYGGKNLQESLSSGKISSLDADFYSITYYFLIGPAESVSVRNLTAKKDRSMKYWAIVNIVEPKKSECIKKTDYLVKAEKRTFTEYRKEKKEITVKEYRRIGELINIKDFGEWLILLILAFLIVILIVKIAVRVKEIRREEKENQDKLKK